MKTSGRQAVRDRAGGRCEYCRLEAWLAEPPSFHVEHVFPASHGGSDDLSNLALSCPACNRFKGPNLAAVDPETGRVVRLFSPREDDCAERFAADGGVVAGRTPTGRATVRLLRMNDADAVARRAMTQELES